MRMGWLYKVDKSLYRYVLDPVVRWNKLTSHNLEQNVERLRTPEDGT